MRATLRKAVIKAGKPHLRKGWALQAEVLSDDEYTVVIGMYDQTTGKGEGMRVTAVSDRSQYEGGVLVTVTVF